MGRQIQHNGGVTLNLVAHHSSDVKIPPFCICPNSSAHSAALCVLLAVWHTDNNVHFMFSMLNVFIGSPVNLIFKQNICTDLPKCGLGCRVKVYCSCNYSLWVHRPVGWASVNLQCEQNEAWSPIIELSPLSHELSPFTVSPAKEDWVWFVWKKLKVRTYDLAPSCNRKNHWPGRISPVPPYYQKSKKLTKTMSWQLTILLRKPKKYFRISTVGQYH